MIVRVVNLSSGAVSINALRTRLEPGESKDIKLLGKLTLTGIDGSNELATLVFQGLIRIEVLEEVVKGYNSGWVDIDQGETVVLTHDLNVATSRMLPNVLYKDADGLVSMRGFGLDTDDTGFEGGYAVIELTATVIKVYRGLGYESGVGQIRASITVEGA